MNNIIISYLTMRKAIGFLALVFPFALIFGKMLGGVLPMEVSISAYYWTTAGDIFVSLLAVIGIFLISYKGYDLRDKIITSIAGVSMLLVALFPCFGTDSPNYIFMFLSPKATGIIHYAAAILTFSFMGVMSFFQFTKGNSGTEGKKKRNKVYKICGIVIGSTILIMLITILFPSFREATDTFRLFFWLESIVVWAFGISWLIKGETLLKDK